MRTRIAVFSYEASICNLRKNGGGECIDTAEIENEINDFCENKEVVDIKVNTVEHTYHNNGGCNGVTLVYTVIYNLSQKEFS